MGERHEFLNELVGGLAHDLSNRLQAAHSVSRDWIARGEPCPVAHLEVIQQSLASSTQLLEQLRDLSRPLGPLQAQVNLGDVMRATAMLVRYTLKESAIALDVESASDVVLATANPMSLTDMLLNLVLNARHAILERQRETPHPSGRITLEAWHEGDSICLEVTDNGCGIEPERLPELFERPWQSTKAQGSGLGLRTVGRVVSAHGGTVDCRSDSSGTTFSIKLPA